MSDFRMPPKKFFYSGLTLWVDESPVSRALQAVAASFFARGIQKINQQPVLLYCPNQKSAETWFWEGLRGSDCPAMNPGIIIGAQEQAVFLEENPAFVIWPSHQAYLKLGPRLIVELFSRIFNMEAIDDESVARKVASSGKHGLESRLLYRLHSWKDGDAGSAAEDLKLLADYFKAAGHNEGLGECRRAHAYLQKKGWSPMRGVEFRRKFERLLMSRVAAKRGN